MADAGLVSERLTIPEFALVLLIGPSGSGKSTFAAEHFGPKETISSDTCRALVADDENDQAATRGAFRILHAIAGERLRSSRPAVIDATNVQAAARKPLIALARKYGCPAVAIVFDLPEDVYLERNRSRPNRTLSADIVRRQLDEMRRSLRDLHGEGFQYVYILGSVGAAERAAIVRQPRDRQLSLEQVLG